LKMSQNSRKLQADTPVTLIQSRERSAWQLFWSAFLRNRLAVIGAVIVFTMVIAAIIGPMLVAYGFDEMHTEDRLQAPNSKYLLGTDGFGRDTLSRLLFAARVSLTVSVLATFVAMIIGVLLGAVAGFWGGWLDDGIMRLIDIMLAFPYMVLAIIIVSVIGPGFQNLVWVLGIIRVPHFARITRSSVLSVRQAEFVMAARAIGQAPYRILFRHILPNCLTPIIVYASLSAATAITAESGLSFLGLGIQPPMSSWGTMISDGLRYMMRASWLTTFPGVAISLTVLGYNALGDGLRDALDPFSIK
jgi:peptide/nickel transport system permease protein